MTAASIVRGVLSYNSAGSAPTGTSITVTAPVGTTAGDQLVLVISERDQLGAAWTPPSGWILVEQTVDNAGEAYFYRAKYGTDITGTSWTWTSSTDTSTDKWAVAGVVLNGSLVGAYLTGDAQIRPDGTANSPTPSITTAVPAHLVALAGDRITGGSTWTWPSGWVEQVDTMSDTGTNAISASSAVYDTTPTAAGTYSVTPVASLASTAGWAGIFAFDVASAPPPSGSGASITLGLTVGSATGARAAAGDSQTLTLTVGAGAGTRAGAGSGQALTLTVGAGVGTSGAALSGPGAGFSLSLSLGTGEGSAALAPSGEGEQITLGLSVGPGDGVRLQWVFHTPTQDVWFRIAGRGLVGSYAQGLTVYRVGGQWRTRLSPGPDELDAADRSYQGGYVHPLSDPERADLIAGGFADNIIQEEVPA